MTSGKVVTVLGDIEPDELGVTLFHEHIYIRLWEIANRFDLAGLIEDDDIISQELQAFAAQGGASVVDMTLPAIGRKPLKLAEMSQRTGLHVVMGCGWYREPYYPASADIDRRTVDDLADELLMEIEHGVEGSRIRPGIVGEIGADKSWITAKEERCHRAAARAALRSGLALATHSVGSDVALHQLDLFEEEGLPLMRVAVGHADSFPSLEYYRTVLARGASLAFDNLGAFPEPYTERILDHITVLLREGFESQILLSHDVCKREMLRFLGGHGYTFVIGQVLPRLQQRGIPDDVLERLVKLNPRELLTGLPPHL